MTATKCCVMVRNSGVIVGSDFITARRSLAMFAMLSMFSLVTVPERDKQRGIPIESGDRPKVALSLIAAVQMQHKPAP